MRVRTKTIHVMIACAYLIATLGISEQLISMLLAGGYFLLALSDHR
jgi:hypothetical protein